MLQIIYELCEDDGKSTWGYGVFTDNGVEELSLEDVLELLNNDQVDNAELIRSRIKILNINSSLPKFRKSDYEPLDEDVSVYVVCNCKVNGEKGYLVVTPLCKLEFIDRFDLVSLCMEDTVCNVYLKPLYNDNTYLWPVQYNMPFRNIGEIELT